eukprot:4307059-Pyramimonas_sp.AAC.1
MANRARHPHRAVQNRWYGPIRCSKRGHILTMDQSDACSTGIFCWLAGAACDSLPPKLCRSAVDLSS